VDQKINNDVDLVAPLVVQSDRAHFHIDQKLMYVKLVVERVSCKVVGFTALGENGDAVVGRVNIIAGLLPLGISLDVVSNLELCYSPSLGAAMDILNVAANTCENLINGKLRDISLKNFLQRLAIRELEEGKNTVFVDVRGFDNVAPYITALSPQWVHFPGETLSQRINEIPRDKQLILVCNSGARSYEAQCLLDSVGIMNTMNLCGGIKAVKKFSGSIIEFKE